MSTNSIDSRFEQYAAGQLRHCHVRCNVPFIPQDEPAVLVKPREKALHDTSFGMGPTAVCCSSSKYAIMVAMCEADATVSGGVVALVRIEGSSSRHGGYDASESWFQEAHIGLIGGRAQKRVWHAQIVNRCGEFGGQAPTVGRIAANTVNPIYIFDKRRIDTAVARAPSPPIQSKKTFVCVAKEASIDPHVHCFEDCDIRDTLGTEVTPLHPGANDL